MPATPDWEGLWGEGRQATSPELSAIFAAVAEQPNALLREGGAAAEWACVCVCVEGGGGVAGVGAQKHRLEIVGLRPVRLL